MDIKYNNWRDFDKTPVKVKIKDKHYEGKLFIRNKDLTVQLDVTKDLVFFKSPEKYFDSIIGVIKSDKTKLTLLSCNFLTPKISGENKNEQYHLIFTIDRIIVGKQIKNLNSNKINEYTVDYEDLYLFTSEKFYNSCFTDNIYYSLNSFQRYIKTPTKKVRISFRSSAYDGDTTFSINASSQVAFQENNKISFYNTLENIYAFKNFLMILLQKDIKIKSQFIKIDKSKFLVVDCGDEILSIKNNFQRENIKIEDIKNIDEVYSNYLDKYENLILTIELYFNVTRFKVPNLIRFVNATTMIEAFIHAFHYDEAKNQQDIEETALKIKDSKYQNHKNLIYFYMVKYLLVNVNSVFNFTDDELDIVADNIKNARVYHIHNNIKANSKILSEKELFIYSHFIQDVILLNIYKLINLDIEKYSSKVVLEYYYDKDDML